MATLLRATIEAARRGGGVKASSVDRVIVDTTVMPTAIAHPTDSRLQEKSRQHLGKVTEEHGIALRQNYNRTAPRLAAQIGRYAHAKQFKRMCKAVRTLCTCVGGVQRDVARQLAALAEQAHKPRSTICWVRTGRILTQRTKDKNKLYALDAPEVEWHQQGHGPDALRVRREGQYRLDLEGGLGVGMRGMPRNPYDAHTLAETLEKVSILAERKTNTAIVDKGYRGVEIEGVRILRSCLKRGITRI